MAIRSDRFDLDYVGPGKWITMGGEFAVIKKFRPINPMESSVLPAKNRRHIFSVRDLRQIKVPGRFYELSPEVYQAARFQDVVPFISSLIEREEAEAARIAAEKPVVKPRIVRVFPELHEAREDVERRNLSAYYRKVQKVLEQTGVRYKTKVLLRTEYGDTNLFYPEDQKGKHILVISGQHGEELAGPWGLLRGIEISKDVIAENSISFIPVGNPRGFSGGWREGSDRRMTSWVLRLGDKIRSNKTISAEAKALVDNGKLLLRCSRDGLLNIHEDNTSLGFYLYVLGDVTDPVVTKMLDTGRRHFEFKKDGVYTDNGRYTIKGGIVDNHPDRSFDRFAFINGIPIAVTIETPARKDVPFEDRVAAASEMMRAFFLGRSGEKEESFWNQTEPLMEGWSGAKSIFGVRNPVFRAAESGARILWNLVHGFDGGRRSKWNEPWDKGFGVSLTRNLDYLLSTLNPFGSVIFVLDRDEIAKESKIIPVMSPSAGGVVDPQFIGVLTKKGQESGGADVRKHHMGLYAAKSGRRERIDYEGFPGTEAEERAVTKNVSAKAIKGIILDKTLAWGMPVSREGGLLPNISCDLDRLAIVRLALEKGIPVVVHGKDAGQVGEGERWKNPSEWNEIKFVHGTDEFYTDKAVGVYEYEGKKLDRPVRGLTHYWPKKRAG